MGKTILELFLESPDLYSPATVTKSDIEKEYENTIDPKAPTKDMPNNYFEQELHGIRIKSLVDINNPLIYGSDVPRIASRSTRTLEIMKEGRTITNGDHGLIGKGISKITKGNLNSINEVRNKIGDFLGLPQPLIPTVVASKLKPGITVQDIIDKKFGTEVGKMLKQSVNGGNLKTIAIQSAGTAVDYGKKLLRGKLFGLPPELLNNEIPIIKEGDEYSVEYPYTDVMDATEYKTTEITKEELVSRYGKFSINLQETSPIFGVDRNTKMWDSDLGTRIRKDKDINPNFAKRLSPYDPSNSYTGKPGERSPIWENSLEKKYQLSSKEDGINSYYKTKDNEKTKKELEEMDLVPFWVGFKDGSTPKTHFRTLLSGISETVSPNWSESSFFGNPFNFYTYGGVGREVTFSLLIYCSSPKELGINWEKMNTLTKYTYPRLEKVGTHGDMVKPPIIDFRLGDIYNGKTGYISSLSYTFPDNGTWETDPKIGLLPKFIEVSVSIHFIEQMGDSTSRLYDYALSDDALKLLNEKSDASNFSTDANMSSNGSVVPSKKLKVITKGLADNISKIVEPIKDLQGTLTDPPFADKIGYYNPKESEGNLISQINETRNPSNGLTPEQELLYNSTLKPQGYVDFTTHTYDVTDGTRVYKDFGTNKIIAVSVKGVPTELN